MSLFRSNEDTGFENNSMFISRKEIQTVNDSYYINPVMKVYNDVKNINNNPIMKVYNDVKNIIKAPCSCWNKLPKWMEIPLSYYCKDVDFGKSAHMHITDCLGTSVYIVASEDIKENDAQFISITSPQYIDTLCCIVNDKYYSQEITYKNYILISNIIISSIMEHCNVFGDNEIFIQYSPIIFITQFINDTKCAISDVNKIIEELNLPKYVDDLGKNGSDVLELSKQLDNPVMELLVNNGIYAILS